VFARDAPREVGILRTLARIERNDIDVDACVSCGTQLGANAKFCSECGAPVAKATQSAEYKQVTILFADVVHSMDLAAAVGAERLREILTELVERAAAVVKRYDGTVDKFTGDGLMAVFGAPVALEDHAVRACLAALEIQDEATGLAVEIRERDGIDFQLRVGLNSGQVIAGEIGSGGFGYTTIGEQVGMAQRMESGAPPGGVMLSASTARLVEGGTVLGDPEKVQVKGADEVVPARRLLGMAKRNRPRDDSALVGRQWEKSAIEGLLQGAIAGHGAVVGIVGPPGIGKSRLVREVASMAGQRGVEVFTGFCESHTKQVPFHAIAGLLRAGTGVEGLDAAAARARIHSRSTDADADDLLLLDDLLGIGDPDIALPQIDPDARRRRLTALVNATSLAREAPAVYVVEDAHWVDEVSESMLADFLKVIPQTPSLVLITYRPEYEGALSRVSGAQTIFLAPLRDSETIDLINGLLGSSSSISGLADTIADRAAGNPFFAEEIVRELAERGVLQGESGAYVLTTDVADVAVPATLQSTIAARIDRLDPNAKRTLSAAAVIGSRFALDLVRDLGVEPVVADLVAAQLIDQVSFTRHPEFVFRHPMIRSVAYESQLRVDRAGLHRRLAAAIEERGSVDENAALIAEHLEAAGDFHGAYRCRMRAATWSQGRDIRAARLNWERARSAAEALPDSDPDRTAMCIAPRTQLCATTWRVGGSALDNGFDEVRQLCERVGDNLSLAIAMYGQMVALNFQHRHREAAKLASEQIAMLQQLPDVTRAFGFVHGPVMVKLMAGEAREAHRVARWAIDLLGDEGAKGMAGGAGSPLAITMIWSSAAGHSLGETSWRDDMRRAIALERSVNSKGVALSFMISVGYGIALTMEAVGDDDEAVRETAEAVRVAEDNADDIALGIAYMAHGMALSRRESDTEKESGLTFIRRGREMHMQRRMFVTATMADIRIAEMLAAAGQVDRAIENVRSVVNELAENDERFMRCPSTGVLVQLLLMRASDADIEDAATEIDRFAAMETDPGFVHKDIQLLRMRALLASAKGDDAAYRDFADRYRAMAESLGFGGHMAIAETMR
jgi:adenylate cyclase